MKTSTFRKLATSSVLGLVLGMVGTSVNAGTITDSRHNFSTSGWSGGRICIVCHTPHNAADPSVLTAAPLWNHEVTQATFNMYSRTSLDGAIGTEPGGVSLLCLSCHDGTVAVDSFGGNTGGTKISGPALIGTDLSNDHPISIEYSVTSATNDGGLHNPDTTSVTIGAGGDKTRTGTISAVMLDNGTVQCNSCHDVHNTFTVPGANGDPLLKVSKAASELCMTCHNK